MGNAFPVCVEKMPLLFFLSDAGLLSIGENLYYISCYNGNPLLLALKSSLGFPFLHMQYEHGKWFA